MISYNEKCSTYVQYIWKHIVFATTTTENNTMKETVKRMFDKDFRTDYAIKARHDFSKTATYSWVLRIKLQYKKNKTHGTKKNCQVKEQKDRDRNITLLCQCLTTQYPFSTKKSLCTNRMMIDAYITLDFLPLFIFDKVTNNNCVNYDWWWSPL